MSLDRSGLENLFWEILRAFEDLALRQYESHVPALATRAKRDFVERLALRAPGLQTLEASEIAAPVHDLLAEAEKADEVHTLIVQGLILENLAQAIYGTADQNPMVEEESRHLASLGHAASMSVTEQIPALLPARFEDSERLFQEFAERSHEILTRLDALGEGVDRLFGEVFSIHFKDIAGAFVARLIPICSGMGMVRRKVVSHLAGAFMGL
jgi:hypothetical protein